MNDVEGGSDVIATYREIATHFRLKGPDQGRTKAKRAGWPTIAQLQNHPSDPVRVSVPREAWDGASRIRQRPGLKVDGFSPSRVTEPLPSQTAEIRHLLVVVEGALGSLKEQLERERERVRDAIERADQLGALATDLRVQVVKTEGERDLARSEGVTLRERTAAAEAQAKGDRAEAEAAHYQAEAAEARLRELEERPAEVAEPANAAAVAFAEEAARQAQVRADEADRRAAVATDRLERFQQDRIASAQVATMRASEAAEIADMEAAAQRPWWRRLVRRR